MIGAVIGDIVGSRYEFDEQKGRPKDFRLFTPNCRFTDDTLMTLAVAKTLIICRGQYSDITEVTIRNMVDIATPYPNIGWGYNFHRWIFLDKRHQPYQSYGNGSGMRISPVGWVAKSEKDVIFLNQKISEVSHNHPEGIKGGEAIAMGVYLARTGATKEEIRNRLSVYYPQLLDKNFSYEKLHGVYGYDDRGDWVTCQHSVPQAIVCFLDSVSFEDAVRNAVSLGGDSDTIGAMTGSIAEAFYGAPEEFREAALSYLPVKLQGIVHAFDSIKLPKA